MNIELFDEYFAYELDQLEVGVIIANYTNGSTSLTIETNGVQGDIFLEVVKYENGTEQEFSEPMYEMPKTIEDAKELFEQYI